MPHNIKLDLYASGLPAIDLEDSNHGIVEYAPATPEDGAIELAESMVVRVAGADTATFLSRIRELQLFFLRAAERQRTNAGWQCFITAQPGQLVADGLYRSEILSGKVVLPDNVLGSDFANSECDVTLIYTRAAWWEEYTETNVLVYSGNGPGNTVTIFNCNDYTGTVPNKHSNWVKILAADVPGDLPASFMAQVRPFTGQYLDDLFITVLTKPDEVAALAESYMGHHEGETGAGDTIDATRAGGKYHTYTIPAGATGLNIEWDVSATASSYAGAPIRTLLGARFTGTVTFRPYVYINNSKRYYGKKSILAPQVANFELLDLDFIKMPDFPMGATAAGWNTVKLGINVVYVPGGTIDVDFVQFLPAYTAARDKFNEGGLNNGTWGINRFKPDGSEAYVMDNSTLKMVGTGIVYGSGNLFPGKINYIIFNWRSGNINKPTDAASITIYRRAKRCTI